MLYKSILIIGGTPEIENVVGLSYDNLFITLRPDYNNIFDGDVIIKNCKASESIKTIFEGNRLKHDPTVGSAVFNGAEIIYKQAHIHHTAFLMTCVCLGSAGHYVNFSFLCAFWAQGVGIFAEI